MTTRFETSQWVPFRIELVFELFADPDNLPELMPPWMQTRIEYAYMEPPPSKRQSSSPTPGVPSHAAGEGSEIMISFCPLPWLPKRIQWKAHITEFVWNKHFCDEQIEGPFAEFYHRHAFRPDVREGVKGTIVTDEIDYALPFGPIGGMFSALVHRQLDQSFEHRQKRLLEILTFAARVAAQCR